jgi:hypothetical protein
MCEGIMKRLKDFAEGRHTVARISTYSGVSVFEP